ncbi:MAG: peptidase M15A [Gammaproteobacteria bacterium]|nr:peptidase M15A [Gammaproteobacteria bacterium]
MKRIQLSRNFFLDEFTRSDIAARNGIMINVPLESIEFYNLTQLCLQVLQPIRDALGPVHITSGYRPPLVNKWVNGSKDSDHLRGQAADFVVAGHTPLQVCDLIAANLDTYHQLIHEFGQWTHIAWHPGKALCDQMTAIKMPRLTRKPKTIYVPGIWSMDDALEIARGE